MSRSTRYIKTGGNRYFLEINGVRQGSLSRRDVTTLLKHRLPESIRVIREYEEQWSPICRACRARPAVMDFDCDGWYSTSRCYTPQCIAGGQLKASRNL